MVNRLPDASPNPSLELRDGTGALITSNDNWVDSPQRQEISDSTIPPTDDRESAIVASLSPGAYTAILSGVNDATGVGLVEVYDLAQTASANLVNISSRGEVRLGDDVMIGGLIVSGTSKVVVRAIGPSLTSAGVQGALQNPTLQVVDANGSDVSANDNWKDGQRAELEALSIQPGNDLEAAVIATLASGNYTAVVRGQGDATGVGLVEVYNVQ